MGRHGDSVDLWAWTGECGSSLACCYDVFVVLGLLWGSGLCRGAKVLYLTLSKNCCIVKGLRVLSMLFGEGGVFFYCFDVLLFFPPQIVSCAATFFFILYVLSAMNIDQIVKNPGLFMGERIRNVPTYCTQMSNSRKVLQNQIHTAHNEVIILAFLSSPECLEMFCQYSVIDWRPLHSLWMILPPFFDVLGWMASDFFVKLLLFFYRLLSPSSPSSLSSDWWQRHWGRNSDVD